MKAQENFENSKDPNQDNDYFLKQLGDFLRFLRINAGFTSIESFANTINMSSTQYGGYEAGKNLTILTFKKILLEFNIKVEDWLNIEPFSNTESSDMLINSMKQARIEQVIEQVKATISTEAANKLTSKEIQRYIDILIFCHKPKSRNEIVEKLLKMDDSTNTFKRVAGNLLEFGWIEPTDKKSRKSPAQRYLITESGKRVLRLGQD